MRVCIFAAMAFLVGCADTNGATPNGTSEGVGAIGPLRGSAGVIVQPKLPGTILGYDVDQHGTDGLLANYDDRSFRVSLETFDQTTGKITKVVKENPETKGDFAVYGILAHDVGFFEHGTGYELMNPVSGERINGSWSPPQGFKVVQIAENQTTSTQVIFGYAGSATELVVTDVAKNSAKVIALDQNLFSSGAVPVIAQDTASDEAVIAAQNGSRYTHPVVGIVNLKNGKTKTFTGLGYGDVDGIGVDSKTHTACTTTGIDAGVEFYNLKTQAGFEVQLPQSEGSELHSGSGVAVDALHGLCIIAQPVPGGTTQASDIVVADEKGDFLEEIPGFNFWFNVTPAIDPARRTGFVVSPRPIYGSLAGFSY